MSLPKFRILPGVAVIALVCSSASAGLIVNGDFEGGNTGFTSDYVYAPALNTTEGQYTVRSDPRNWNASFAPTGDHTSGSGQMLVVNGAPNSSLVVWQQIVAVTPNTDYDFSMWVSSAVSNGPASLEVSINGALLGSPFAAPGLTGFWDEFSEAWNSGASNTAQITIIDGNLAVFPNDFYIDDISFASQSPASVPEPASMLMWCLGTMGFAGCRWRRQQRVAQAI